MSVRRMLPFLLINIVVSAIVVLAILFWWDNRQSDSGETTRPELDVPTIPSSSPEVASEPQAPQDIASEDEGPIIYIVKAGDTLGSIVRDYDVSMDDIMTANGIENPNFLQVGQELIIPVGGIPTATPLPSPTPSPDVAPSPIPTQLPTDGEAIVTISDVVGVGNLDDEAVSIVNSGSRPIALLGWRLLDEEDRSYTFGQVTLFGDGAAILVHTGSGQDGPSDLYWGSEEVIWQPGETITLLDAEGTIRATLVVSNP